MSWGNVSSNLVLGGTNGGTLRGGQVGEFYRLSGSIISGGIGNWNPCTTLNLSSGYWVATGCVYVANLFSNTGHSSSLYIRVYSSGDAIFNTDNQTGIDWSVNVSGYEGGTYTINLPAVYFNKSASFTINFDVLFKTGLGAGSYPIDYTLTARRFA